MTAARTMFEKIWQRHIVVDHVGDVREHLSFDLAGFEAQHRK